MPQNKQTVNVNPNTLLIVGGLGLAYFGFINPILKKIGVKTGEEDREKNKQLETAEKGKAFNADYWKTAPRPKLLFGASPSAKQVAKEIKDSFGFFNDDEDRIFAAIKRCRTKTMVSQLASAYRDEYKADLYNTLKSNLSDDELFTIVKYTNSLPDR